MVYVCKGETLFFPVCFVCCSCRRGWDYGRCCVTLLLPVHLRQKKKKKGKNKGKKGCILVSERVALISCGPWVCLTQKKRHFVEHKEEVVRKKTKRKGCRQN